MEKFIEVTVDKVDQENNVLEVSDSNGKTYKIKERLFGVEVGKRYSIYKDQYSETGYSIIPF